MQGVAESRGELAEGDRVGCDEIDRAGELAAVEQVIHRGDGIGQGDPAYILPAGAEDCAEAEAEHGGHRGKGAAVAAEDDAEAHIDDADTRLCGWGAGGFPVFAPVGDDSLSRG